MSLLIHPQKMRWHRFSERRSPAGVRIAFKGNINNIHVFEGVLENPDDLRLQLVTDTEGRIVVDQHIYSEFVWANIRKDYT